MFGEETIHLFSIPPLLLLHAVTPECKVKDTIAPAPLTVSHIFLANVFLHFHCLPR